VRVQLAVYQQLITAQNAKIKNFIVADTVARFAKLLVLKAIEYFIKFVATT
jgi:hypothetical protein